MSQLVTFVRQGEKTISVLGGGGRNERKQRADSEGTSSSFSDFWVSFVIPCTCTDTKRLTKACKEFVIVHTWPMKGTKNFSQLKSKNIESFVRLKEHLNFFADVFLYSMFVFLYYFPPPFLFFVIFICCCLFTLSRFVWCFVQYRCVWTWAKGTQCLLSHFSAGGFPASLCSLPLPAGVT